ncbi:MAG: GerW family sporulation protein [Clostridia bacterium]
MERQHTTPGDASAVTREDGHQHPIQGLMETAMASIQGMIDVTTVMGDPVHTEDGSTIIPFSRVSLGFAAGGGEYMGRPGATSERPFGGGSGAGVAVQPVGFLVQRGDQVRVLSVEGNDMLDRLVDLAPEAIGTIQDLLAGRRRGHHDHLGSKGPQMGGVPPA